jgi:hypothetical protein
MKNLFIFIILFLVSCSEPEPITPASTVDIVAYSVQEGVLEITPDRYSIHPTSWHTRGRVVNAIWQNGELVSGTIYHINPAKPEEWEVIGRQAVLHFSPDPVDEIAE